MMSRILGTTAVIALLAVGGGLVAQAQDKPTGLVAYRQAVMKGQEAHMLALVAILTDHKQLMDQAPAHARALNDSADMVAAAFKENTGTGKTRAKPGIWEDWAAFEVQIATLKEKTTAMLAAAETGDVDATLAALGDLGKNSCTGCHTDFREK